MLHEIGHIPQEKDYPKYEKLKSLEISGKLTSEEDIKKFIDIVMGLEREAHNFAIKKLRQLRKDGIDLEPELKRLSDIGELIHQALATHRIKKRRKPEAV